MLLGVLRDYYYRVLGLKKVVIGVDSWVVDETENERGPPRR